MNKLLIRSLLVIILCAIGSSGFSSNGAMWVWYFQESFDKGKRKEMFDFCKSKDIATIYLQIPYEPLSKKSGNEDGVLNRTRELREVLAEAHKMGIRVDALDGAAKFALNEEHPYVLKQVDAILSFNKQGKDNERFDGIHYDIEPHSLPAFKNGQHVAICKQYLELVSAISDKIKNSGQNITLGLDIPMWYDKNTDDNGKLLYQFSWKNHVKTMDQHLLDIVDEIAIMDYRTKSEGDNGAIANAKNEILYADSINKKVWVGLETSEAKGDPPSISFFGHPLSDFDKVASDINQAFQKNKSYQGIAAHYYESYKALTKNKTK